MVTKKVSKPLARDQRRTRSALSSPRRRVHALAPEHVGELGSVAALAVAVLGVAIFILAAMVLVSGITLGSRFSGGTSPPNLDELGRVPMVLGAVLLVWSVLLIAAPVALLADFRRARMATVVTAALSAVAGLGALAFVLQRGGNDPVLYASLGVLIVIFGASTLILVRPGR